MININANYASEKNIVDALNYVTTKNPVPHYPKMARTNFAAKCCEIASNIFGTDDGWISIGKYVEINGSAHVCASNAMTSSTVISYINYVLNKLSLHDCDCPEFNDTNSSILKDIDAAIPECLDYLAWIFVRVGLPCDMPGDGNGLCNIPMEIKVFEYTPNPNADCFSNITMEPVANHVKCGLAVERDLAVDKYDLMGKIRSCVRDNYEALLHYALHTNPTHSLDYYVFSVKNINLCRMDSNWLTK